MADNVSSAAEKIAFRLLVEIANAEGKSVRSLQGGSTPDRKWLLDTYAECLMTVKLPAQRLP